MRVRVTKRAERRIEIVDRFWRKNRHDAPNLFKEELATAEVRLSEDPHAGRACISTVSNFVASCSNVPNSGCTTWSARDSS